jgi:hypothetical protein
MVVRTENVKNVDTVENMENVERMEKVENVENVGNVENADNIENADNMENIDNIENIVNMENVEAMKLTGIAKKTIAALCALLLPLVAGSIVYYRSISFLPFALGALAGISLNIGKVLMLDRVVSKSVAMEADRAGNYIRAQYLLRLLLTGLVLFAAVSVSFIDLWGVAAGILMLPVATMISRRINFSAGKPI